MLGKRTDLQWAQVASHSLDMRICAALLHFAMLCSVIHGRPDRRNGEAVDLGEEESGSRRNDGMKALIWLYCMREGEGG